MRITTRFLASKGACFSHRVIFATEWPGGVEISLESLTRAAELGLDISWLATNTLTATAYAAYEAAIAPAYAAYEAARVPAYAAYEAARATAYAAYEAARATAYAAYKAAIVPAYWTAYQSQEQTASA